MKLSAPKTVVFCIAVILAVAAIVFKFVDVSFLSDNHFWILLVGFVVLFLGNLVKGI